MPRNTDTLQIGLAIKAILSDSQALANVIGENKVFPVVAPEGTTFPFVLYGQTGIRETGTKDGLHDETTPLYRSLMQRIGIDNLLPIHSIAMVLEVKS